LEISEGSRGKTADIAETVGALVSKEQPAFFVYPKIFFSTIVE
jgi:hypothetical protein